MCRQRYDNDNDNDNNLAPPFWPQMRAKRACNNLRDTTKFAQDPPRSFKKFGQEESKFLNWVFRDTLGRSFKSGQTHFLPLFYGTTLSDTSPSLPLSLCPTASSGGVRRQRGIWPDQIMFHKRSHLWQRCQRWRNDLLHLPSYLNFFTDPRDVMDVDPQLVSVTFWVAFSLTGWRVAAATV